MKILITADPEIPVPPALYGGIERIVEGLAKEYSLLGHEVYLVANPESQSEFPIEIIGWHASQSQGLQNILKNARLLRNVVQKIKPDVIHSFSRLLYLYPLLFETKIKIIQSYQREISQRSTSVASFLFGEKIIFTACGKHMLRKFSREKFKTIHNFTDTVFYGATDLKVENRLVYLGRIEDIKGTFEAIKVALECNLELVIAGNVPEDQNRYFEKYIEPYLSNPLIKYVGPVNDQQKKYWLQSSKAMLFPIKWEEPFGIVMAESLACGTPVIGFNRGSVPEVVKNGETGFVVNTINEMIEKVGCIDKINRDSCRERAEAFFDSKVIAQKYISIMR